MVGLATVEEIFSEVLKMQTNAPIELLEEENDVESSREDFPARNVHWRKVNRERMVGLPPVEEILSEVFLGMTTRSIKCATMSNTVYGMSQRRKLSSLLIQLGKVSRISWR